jgi:hypothetical protein
MSQTFADWNSVPQTIERKISKMWQRCGAACRETSTDSNGKKVEVYKLVSHKVIDNLDYLTDAQKIKLFEMAANHGGVILHNLLHSLSFEPEAVRVTGDNEIYYVPGMIVGTWPHCGLFGGMAEDGSIHT